MSDTTLYATAGEEAANAVYQAFRIHGRLGHSLSVKRWRMHPETLRAARAYATDSSGRFIVDAKGHLLDAPTLIDDTMARGDIIAEVYCND